MAALIARELRRLRAPVAIVFGLMVATGLGWLAYKRFIDAKVYGSAMILWIPLLPLLALGLGAHIFATERAHRETAFSRSWPVSAWQVWLAKAIVSVGLLALGYGLFIYVTAWTDPRVLLTSEAHGAWAMALHAAICLLLLAVGMAASSVTATPLGALVVGVLALAVVLAGMAGVLEGIVGPLWGPLLGLHWLTVVLTLVAPTVLAVALSAVFLGASAAATLSPGPLEHTRRTRTGAKWLAILSVAVIPPLLLAALVFGEPDAGDITDAYVSEAEGSDVLIWEPYYYAWSAEVWRLWRMRDDGGELRCVARWPSWPVDTAGPGEVVSWGARSGESNTLWYAEPGGRLRKLPVRSNAERALASPSGRLLCVAPYVLQIGKRIEVLDARLPEGKEERSRDPHNVSPLAFAPDESALYWRYGVYSAPDALWSMDLQTGESRLVASPPEEATNAWPSISPDGRWVAWTATKRFPEPEPGDGAERIPDEHWTVIEEVGGERRRVIADTRPREWSPDGTRILVYPVGGGDVSIVQVPSGATIATIVARVPRAERWGCHYGMWSPDGNRLTLSGFRTIVRHLGQGSSGDTRQYSLWVANADGSGMRRLCLRDNMVFATWVSDDRLLVSGWRSEEVVSIDLSTGRETVVLRTHSRKAPDYPGLSQ